MDITELDHACASGDMEGIKRFRDQCGQEKFMDLISNPVFLSLLAQHGITMLVFCRAEPGKGGIGFAPEHVKGVMLKEYLRSDSSKCIKLLFAPWSDGGFGLSFEDFIVQKCLVNIIKCRVYRTLDFFRTHVFSDGKRLHAGDIDSRLVKLCIQQASYNMLTLLCKSPENGGFGVSKQILLSTSFIKTTPLMLAAASASKEIFVCFKDPKILGMTIKEIVGPEVSVPDVSGSEHSITRMLRTIIRDANVIGWPQTREVFDCLRSGWETPHGIGFTADDMADNGALELCMEYNAIEVLKFLRQPWSSGGFGVTTEHVRERKDVLPIACYYNSIECIRFLRLDWDPVTRSGGFGLTTEDARSLHA